ncbi:GuKc [Nesidiocoris tenuis]|uniref:GuKc n=1 Tax=Nesidiocoris tenuis TaxID=355587 RepID=A0ABN7A9B5_9HEMI|nr:GuKc [Nesidiocoris tenuis]
MSVKCFGCILGPAGGFRSTTEAMDHIKENIYELEKRTGAKDTDILFLKSLIDDPLVRSIVNAQDSLEKKNKSKHEDLKPVDTETAKLAKDVTTACRLSSNLNARELAALLSKPHVKALLTTHDTVAVSHKNKGSVWESTGSQLPLVEEEHTEAMATQAIRVVGLRKTPKEPLVSAINYLYFYPNSCT